ncbi:MAG: hypothetical protein GY754_03675 [bacterium]|nr:hypothetical protein [bacterium]
MIDKKEAIKIAKEYITTEFGDEIVLSIDTFREHQFVYIFYYQSKNLFRSSDFTDIFLGSGPNIIDKYDGSVTAYGSGYIEDEVVIRYYNEKKYTHNLIPEKDKEEGVEEQRIMSQDEIDSFLNEIYGRDNL